MSRNTFRRGAWVPVTRQAGLEGIRVHDLRHAHAVELSLRSEMEGSPSVARTGNGGHVEVDAIHVHVDTEKARVQRPEYLVEHLGADRGRALGPREKGSPEVVVSASRDLPHDLHPANAPAGDRSALAEAAQNRRLSGTSLG